MKKIFDHFFIGINYWSSKCATNMWREYDPQVVEQDMRLFSEAGISVIRVFPRWDDFQPLTAFLAPNRTYEYGINGRSLPDSEAGRAGVDEKMCEHFENLCEIAARYHITIVVGLLTGQMSFGNFIPPALINFNVVKDSRALQWELRYIKYLVKRLKKIDNIVAWDLGNEVNCIGGFTSKEDFYVFASILSDAIRSADQTRPILTGVGGFDVDGTQATAQLVDVAEYCDANTVHCYNIFETPQDPVNSMRPILDNLFKCRLSEDIGGIPTFIQEFGAIGYMNCSQKSEAEFYRAVTLSALAHGFHGVMYWCAFDQGNMLFPPYNWNNIGSDYGFFDQSLKAKPIVEESKRLQSIMQTFGDTCPPNTDCTVIVQREEGSSPKPMLLSAYLLAKRANLEPGFCYALGTIPKSKLYIFPSVKSSKAITGTAFSEIMENVQEGASLYISFSNAYFRNVPELGGITIENRYDCGRMINLNLENEILPISSPVHYDIHENGCDVLARDEDGTPIFVKKKHGKGFVYLLFAPLEEYLEKREGAFYLDSTPSYEKIYRKIAENVDSKKISVCDSNYILCTEHPGDGDKVYIFAINYCKEFQKTKIKIRNQYTLSTVWGESFDAKTGEISLAPCDGILLVAEKKALQKG